MTLDEFVALMTRQRDVIAEHFEREKLAWQTTMNDKNIAIYDAKLDLMNWVVERAGEIEVPKTKMREFL